MVNKISFYIKWIWDSTESKSLRHHFMEFSYIWLLLIGLMIISIVITPANWTLSYHLIGITLALLTALVLIRPMNAVYGLMGTSGSIRLFFFNFLLISIFFSIVYYYGFFRYSGISYDVNQPHIDFQMFANTTKVDSVKTYEKKNTLFFEHKLDSIIFTETVINTTTDTLHYQRIDFLQVWRSTILTTLTQESADLLSIASVHNEAMDSKNSIIDKEKSDLFEWILIFHIIISWIFFGVFISMLYSKFRNEA